MEHPPPDRPAQPPAYLEDWKRARMELGEQLLFQADQPEHERTVKAEWIDAAARNGRAVELTYAVIVGPLKLTDVEIKDHFRLRNCSCSSINVSDSRFLKGASLNRTTIAGDFRATRSMFVRTFEIERLNVTGVTDLSSAVAAELCGAGAVFGEGVNFNQSTIARGIHLAQATFAGSASFDEISVEHNLDLSKIACTGTLSIYRARVKGALRLFEARVAGRFTCARTSVGTWLNLNKTRFYGDRADFESLSVAENLTARRTSFETKARFFGTSVGGQAHFGGARFTKASTFERLDVKSTCFFSADPAGGVNKPAVFGSGVTFHGAVVGANLNFTGVIFRATSWFHKMRVGVDLIAKQANFAGEVVFSDAEVGNDALFAGSRFAANADFSRFNVKGRLWFQNTRGDDKSAAIPAALFKESVTFNMAKVGQSALFRDVTFHKEANFERIKVTSSALFWNAKFYGKARFLQANLGDLAVFDGSIFENYLDLRLAQTSTIVFNARRRELEPTLGYEDELLVIEDHPKEKNENRTKLKTIDLRGCEYETISTYVRPLLDAFSSFDRRPYLQVEQALRRAGLDELANGVYYTRRRAEGDRLRFNTAGYWTDRLVRLTTGYGVRPLRIALTAALLIVIGTAGFYMPATARPKPSSLERVIVTALISSDKKTPKVTNALSEEEYCRHYQRPDLETAFWLAVQTVSPVEIPPDSGWKPAACPLPFVHWKNYFFSAMLRIFGVIFIGLTAASFTGFLRYIGNR